MFLCFRKLIPCMTSSSAFDTYFWLKFYPEVEKGCFMVLFLSLKIKRNKCDFTFVYFVLRILQISGALFFNNLIITVFVCLHFRDFLRNINSLVYNFITLFMNIILIARKSFVFCVTEFRKVFCDYNNVIIF